MQALQMLAVKPCSLSNCEGLPHIYKVHAPNKCVLAHKIMYQSSKLVMEMAEAIQVQVRPRKGRAIAER